MSKVLLGLSKLYKIMLSPLLGPCCRYYPSCSEYFTESISRFGALRGSLTGLLRVARCNPFFPGGIDQVK